ncbi:MAG TPA: ABC transporter substrate-binding protein [Vicinamibacterales bacterium]
MGIGGLSSLSAERGVQQFISGLTVEGLFRVNQEGRLEAWLAKSSRLSSDGKQFTIELRPDVKFHDGSPVDATVVAAFLKENLPRALRTLNEDVESIAADNDREVTIRFKQPSTFIPDALFDLPLQKAGASPPIGTGPFKADTPPGSAKGTATMSAFEGYYLSQPIINRIDVKTYPSTRAAWAELLRDNIDMLYEVGSDMIDVTNDPRVALYTFDRPYQYVVLLNTKSPKLKSPEIRKALNEAIDRSVVIREGLAGHGTASNGPVSSHHWAFANTGETFNYEPELAAATLRKSGTQPLELKILTPSEAPYEHLAIIIQQQLQAVGVNVSISEVSAENLGSAISKPDFEAMLIDAASGWSLYRPYRWWHSKSTQNLTGFASSSVDSSLDRIRHAVSEADYKAGVASFIGSISNDPPAIFLAWGDRSRAVSRQFDTRPEPGRDVLATLRLWRPTADKMTATRH